MKKIIYLLFFFVFLIFPIKVSAVVYEETDQNTMHYNINNFYLDGNYIVINGWSTTNKHQHLTGNDTHEYSLVLTNKKNNLTKTYVATLMYADKTNLLKRTEERTPCTTTYSSAVCYYQYTYAGFQFRIPISDLESDNEYAIKLRIYEKVVNRGLQQSIYAIGINNTYDKDGVRYQLYSDISKTNVTLTAEHLFVRSGPGQNYSRIEHNMSCAVNNVMYWYPFGYFNNILDSAQTNPGAIDSELWIKLGFEYYGCVGGKARAINGTSHGGWAPWIYMLGGGTPATIKTTALNTVSIEELRTYTAKKNTNTKALLTLTNTRNDSVTINAYHNGNKVYSKVETFSGTKTFNINYKIPNDGWLNVEVVARYKTLYIGSNIYVSSEKVYEVPASNSGVITVDTPILVVTDKNGRVTNYKEKIQLSAVPYDINISQGRGISGVTSAITYWYPLEEFALNSDYKVYALYSSQEDTLNYEVVNGKVKVNLEKDTTRRGSNYDISVFHHPNVLLSLINGDLYTSKVNGKTYYNGGTVWYPSWDDELGTYSYQYVGEKLGINQITIKKNLEYTITDTMFGSDTGKFYIKRVENPNTLNTIYKRTFTSDELKEYLKGIS